MMKENSFKSVSVIADNFLTMQDNCWNLSKRGSNILLYSLIDKIHKRYNINFKVIQQGKSDENFIYKDIEIIILKGENFNDFKKNLKKIKFDSDIVHYNNIDFFTGREKRYLRTATIHTNAFLEKARAKNWLDKNILFFDKVVVVNNSYKELFPDTQIIKNGIPLEVFDYKPKHSFTEPIKILFPNIDSPKKNRNFAIDLIKRLNKKYGKIFKLILVGDKEDLGINGKLCEFVGIKNWGKEMNSLYKESFITIIPSISESCSLCALESMSSGTVVFANDIEGIRDYIFDKETGFLINVNNIDSWLKMIEELLRDKVLYDKIQSRARCSVEEDFNIERMSEEYYLMWLKLFKMKNEEG